MTRVTQTFQLTVTAAPTAPAWFTVLPTGTWSRVSASSTILDLKPTLTVDPNNKANNVGVINAWTGGAVDFTGKRMLLCANGGHEDWAGNETYTLDLTSDTSPVWVRSHEPFPTPTKAEVSYPTIPANADGSMRSLHTANGPQFINGKVWFPTMSSYTSGLGKSAPIPWSFDTATGAWQNFGPVYSDAYSTDSFGFLPSAIDRETGLIWTIMRNFYPVRYYSVDTADGTVQTYTTAIFVGGQSANYSGSWSVVAKVGSSKFWLTANGSSNSLAKLDLNNVAAGLTSQTTQTNGINFNPNSRPFNPTVAGEFAGGYGAVYHEPSKSIYLMCPWMHSKMLKLTIPTAAGEYDPAGTWEWSEITPVTDFGPFDYPATYWGTHSKFGLVDDMGDGRQCMVLVCTHTQGAYVMPVASGGLA